MDIVSTQDDVTLTAGDINLSARVQSFKDDLKNVRAARVSAIQQAQGIAQVINNQKASKEDLIGKFQDEAYQMYPELATLDIYVAMQGLSAAHPLMQLWSQYQTVIGSIDQSIGANQKDLEVAIEQVGKAEVMEKQILQMYAQFASGFVGQVPSVEQMVSDLQVIEAIPVVEAGNVQVTKPALEMLSPEAADMVMLQAMENKAQEDYYQDPDDMKDGEYTGSGEMQTMIDQSVPMRSIMDVTKFKHFWPVVGTLAVAWLLFGGKKQ